MTTSEIFVWVFLPSATEPVVAGKLVSLGDRLVFTYGRSYLERHDALAIYETELPLISGTIEPLSGLKMASCIRDASPDAWGRRVLINRLFGQKRNAIDAIDLDEITCLIESGSDRIGALDFQSSATLYSPRASEAATLQDLLTAAECVEAGTPLNPDLDTAQFHGSSIGGARPKALLTDAKRKLIAKFSSQSDFYNVIKAEFVAMRLAQLCGIKAANVEIVRAVGKDVLLIERFDREMSPRGWLRKSMVSALTLFGLDEMSARYASYADLCEIIRVKFINPKATLRELFSRLVFSILVGNTDDHARNHAAFVNGVQLELTPAYDICPQTRTGNETAQAMFITADDKQSRLSVCLKAAPNFMLTEAKAAEIIENQLETLRSEWTKVCDMAELPSVERNYFAGRQFLNESIFFDLPTKYAAWGSIARGI